MSLHATQGVTLQRDVGYKSIGHGYYLEEGTETNNKFYAKSGFRARSDPQSAKSPEGPGDPGGV